MDAPVCMDACVLFCGTRQEHLVSARLRLPILTHSAPLFPPNALPAIRALRYRGGAAHV